MWDEGRRGAGGGASKCWGRWGVGREEPSVLGEESDLSVSCSPLRNCLRLQPHVAPPHAHSLAAKSAEEVLCGAFCRLAVTAFTWQCVMGSQLAL